MNFYTQIMRGTILCAALVCLNSSVLAGQSTPESGKAGAQASSVDVHNSLIEKQTRKNSAKKLAKELKRLAKRLKLSEAQRDTVDILLHQREETVQQSDVKPKQREEYDKVVKAARAEFEESLMAVLTPKQLEKHIEWSERRKIRENIQTIKPTDHKGNNK